MEVGGLEVEEDTAAQEGSLDSGQEDKLTRGREGGRGRERKRERRREGGRWKSQWDVTHTSVCMMTHHCSLNLWYIIHVYTYTFMHMSMSSGSSMHLIS